VIVGRTWLKPSGQRKSPEVVKMNMNEEAWNKTPREIIMELDGLKSDIESPYYKYLTLVLQQKQLEEKSKGKWIDWLHRLIFPLIGLILLGLGIYTRSIAPEYSIVGKDGTILLNKGFNQYGLFVEEKSLPIIDGHPDDKVPTYILKFNKVPSYFEITTKEGATPKVKQIDTNKYEVQFTVIGYRTESGIEINKCNFKIQAY
jgi:hypothetical protein